MSNVPDSVQNPSDGKSFHWGHWVVCSGKRSWKWLLAFITSVLFFGGYLSGRGNVHEIYRKSVGANQEIVVLQGPYHPTTVLYGLLKINGERGYMGSTEIRVELRTGIEVVPLWSSLRKARSDPGKEPMINVLDVIVRPNYLVMVTYDRYSTIHVRRIYPYGNESLQTCADVETAEIGSWWIVSVLPAIPSRDIDVAAEIRELPDDRISLTIKDLMAGPPNPNGSGWQYPVFEQDKSGKWEFKLKNPDFMSSRNSQ